MSILIAVPTFENVKTDTYLALWQLKDDGIGTPLTVVKGYDCARARTEIARRAIEGGHSHVLTVDSDTVPPPHALKTMLDDRADVVLGWYARRGHRTQTTVDGLDGDPLHAHELRGLAERGEPLVPVRRGGLGCALIRTGVFGLVARPWFDFEELGDSCISEDYWFCRAVREAGMEVFVDARVECRHVTEVVL